VGQAFSHSVTPNIYHRLEQDKIHTRFLNEENLNHADTLLKNTLVERKRLNLAGTPFLYSLFFLSSSGNYENDYQIYRLFCLLSFFVAITYLSRILKFPWALAFLAPVVLSALFWPFHVDVRYGNVNQLQIGALALLVFLLQKKSQNVWEFLAGFIIGIGLMFKPNILYSIALVLVSRTVTKRFKSSALIGAGIIIGMAGAFSLPSLLFGEVCTWRNWFPTFQEIVFRKNYFNSSLLGMFFVIRETWPYQVFGLFLLTTTSLLVFIQRKSTHDDIYLTGLGLLIYILSGPLVHRHYFLLAIPQILWMLRPLSTQLSWRKFISLRHAAGALALALIAINFESPGSRQWNPNLESYLGVLILFVGSIVNELPKSLMRVTSKKNTAA
jgi:hypothetical protein